MIRTATSHLLKTSMLLATLSLNAQAVLADGLTCVDLFHSKNSAGAPMSVVEKMQNRKMSSQEATLQNLIMSQGLVKTSSNYKNLPYHDNNYSFVLPEGTIKDQKQSGRCWLFAGLTTLENYHLVKGDLMPDAEFSRVYLQFFNMLERSSSHLDKVIALRKNSQRVSNDTIRGVIQPGVADGGYYEDFMFLVQKYGLVPSSAMPENANSLNTGPMLEQLNTYLQGKSYELWNLAENMNPQEKGLLERVAKGQRLTTSKFEKIDLSKLTDEQMDILQKKKAEILEGVWLILETNLGTPPKKFQTKIPSLNTKSGRVEIALREFRPLEFAKDYLKYNPEDWVNVANMRSFPRDQAYQVKYRDMNRAIRRLNLDPQRMMNLVKGQLMAGMPVWFDSNFGPGVNRLTGDLEPSMDNNSGVYPFKKGQAPPRLSEAEMALLGRLTADHATVFMGFDQPSGYASPLKFKVENSWGMPYGFQGNFNLYAKWFDLYVNEIIIHKSFLTPQELQIYQGPVTKLKAVNE